MRGCLVASQRLLASPEAGELGLEVTPIPAAGRTLPDASFQPASGFSVLLLKTFCLDYARLASWGKSRRGPTGLFPRGKPWPCDLLWPTLARRCICESQGEVSCSVFLGLGNSEVPGSDDITRIWVPPA